MTVFNDTPANVATLAAALRFVPVTAQAWIHAEGQLPGNPTNPLNCAVPRAYQGKPLPHPGAPASAGAIGVTPGGRFYVYRTPADGLAAAVHALNVLSPLYGYGRILAQAGSGDAYAQARAIELSSWAAGNYGATPTSNGAVARYVLAHPAPVPEDPTMPLPTDKPLAQADFTPGATLYANPDGTGANIGAWPGGKAITCGAYAHPRPAPEAALIPIWTGGRVWYGGVDHIVPGSLAIIGATPAPPPAAPHVVVVTVDGAQAATFDVP